MLARHLAAHDMPTRIAASAEEGERILADGLRPALVLLDINLPGESGWSILRSPAYAAAGSPRVVVVSATRIPSSRLREYGVAGYLPKPFAMDTLLETARRYTTARPDESEGAPDVSTEVESP
jgi:DNA-binding response OmpR family regulator